jgi:hypothetical protein
MNEEGGNGEHQRNHENHERRRRERKTSAAERHVTLSCSVETPD